MHMFYSKNQPFNYSKHIFNFLKFEKSHDFKVNVIPVLKPSLIKTFNIKIQS